ncbi:MAG TPA: polysaccharide pyruvyl transferase family protein [Longimicrobiales bacterium]
MSGSVIVHGFYGAGNVGDEAILSVLLRDLARDAAVTPVVFSSRPREVRRLHGVPSLDPNGVAGLAGWWRLRRSRAFILGGGGLLKDYGESPEGARAWLRWLRRARGAGHQRAVWAVGVENLRFAETRRSIRETLEEVDLVTVRDEASMRRLREIGVTRPIGLAADPAVTLADARRRVRRWRDRPRIAVCLRHWFRFGPTIADPQQNERMLDALARALDFAVAEWDARIEFVPFRTAGYDDDRRVMRSVSGRMRHGGDSIHQSRPTPERAAELLADADLVVGMRLHSVILATAAGVPTLALSYMEKVADYMSTIHQERYCMPVEEAAPDRLLDMLLALQRDYSSASAQLVAASEALAARYAAARDDLIAMVRT